MLHDLIAIDLETGGTTPGIHPPLSIAAITADGHSYHSLIRPVDGLLIDPEAVAVNGYTPEAWVEAKDVHTVARELQDFVSAAKERTGAWIPLAHNAGFDKGFLTWIEAHTTQSMGLSYRWECSMSVFAFLMRRGILPKGKASLDRLCALAGLSRLTPHDALSDAQACMDGYRWLLSRCPQAHEPAADLQADTEAYAVLRQVQYLFNQPNPTPKLLVDTRETIADYLDRHGIRAPQITPPLPTLTTAD